MVYFGNQLIALIDGDRKGNQLIIICWNGNSSELYWNNLFYVQQKTFQMQQMAEQHLGHLTTDNVGFCLWMFQFKRLLLKKAEKMFRQAGKFDERSSLKFQIHYKQNQHRNSIKYNFVNKNIHNYGFVVTFLHFSVDYGVSHPPQKTSHSWKLPIA